MKYYSLLLLLCVLFIEDAISREIHEMFTLSRTFFNFLKKNGEYVLEISGGNTRCAKDLKMLLSDLLYGKRWALEMIDASAKPPSGIIQGNYFVPGNFDQCMNIKEDKNATVIQGKYCTVLLSPSSKFSNDFTFMFDALSLSNYMGFQKTERYENLLKIIKVTYGICIPSSCSIEILQDIWNYIEQSLRIPVHVGFVDLMCRVKDEPVDPYGYIDDIIIIIFLTYFGVIITGTIYDVMTDGKLKEKNTSSIWKCFSLYTNGKKIFAITSENETELNCINGIKVLSTIWIVFGHRFLMNGMSGTINSVYLYEWNKEMFASLVYVAYFAVDTFFTLSGFLIVYGFLEYHKRTKRELNFSMFYFYRFLRLSPALLATVLFYITIFKKIGDGPFWPLLIRKFGGCCIGTGWSTMLYLTNFLPFNRQCMEHTWYLAVDTQLYVIAPVLLINLLRNSRQTLLLCVIGCLISGLYTFVVTLVNNYGAVITDSDYTFYRNVYTSTFTRMPPWLIGFIFGYLLFKYQHHRISKLTVISTWILSVSSLVLVTLSHTFFFNYGYSALQSAVYNSCAKQVWSIAICSIIFLCTSGHGGKINDFLSATVFRVLVRICYSVYLIHIPVLTYFGGTKRHSEYLGNIKGLHDFFGDMVFIFIAGTFWCLAFESPFLAIAKRVYKKGNRTHHSDNVKSVKHEVRDELTQLIYDKDFKDKSN